MAEQLGHYHGPTGCCEWQRVRYDGNHYCDHIILPTSDVCIRTLKYKTTPRFRGTPADKPQTFFSMDVFKDVDVSTWAKVTFPLLAVTITFAIIASWWVIGKFRAAHIGLMGEVTEDVVPPESRIDSIKNRLRSALSFWSGDDDVDRGDRGGRESKGDIKKALLGISRWFLPRNRETTDGIRDVEMGFKAESVGTLSLR